MKKIHQLEGVRGIGALIVFVCHFQIVFFPEFYHIVLANLKHFLPLNACNFFIYLVDLSIIGNIFLHIFWALSAYVIFKKFFEKNTRGESLLASCIKRYFRLMIPCAASIFFSYLLFKFGLIYVRSIHISVLQQNLYAFPPSLWHAIETSVWSTFFNYDFYNSYNGPLWTIEREFYGSIFCFGMFGIIGMAKNRSYFYAVIFVCVLILKMYWLNSFLLGYYLSDYDFSARGRTGFLHNIAERINTFITSYQIFSFLVFVIAFLTLRLIPYWKPDYMDAVNSCLSFLIILMALRVNFVVKLMSVPALNKLGQVSFGLYLLHWPFMCAFTSWAYLKFDHSTYLSLGLLFISTLVFSMTLAWLFYRFVDISSIKWSGRVAKYFNNLTKDDVPAYMEVPAQALN